MNPDELQRMTVKELKALALERKILVNPKAKKPELIHALSQGTAAAKPAPKLTAERPAGASSMPAERKKTAVGPLGEPGLPIPDRYGHDRLVLLVQDPQHVFAYWELTGDALAKARQALGEDGAPVLLIHSTAGSEQREIDLSGGNYYLAVAPNAQYRAELALRGANGRLVCIVRSNEVRMPRSGPSENVDEEWMAVDETFSELLMMAGLPGGSGSSATAAKERESRLKARLWHETAVSPLSSGALLSSYHLSSSALQKKKP